MDESKTLFPINNLNSYRRHKKRKKIQLIIANMEKEHQKG